MTSIFRIGRLLAVLALVAGARRADAAAALSASVVVQSAATVSVGQSIVVSLTVTNYGDADAVSVSPFIAAQSPDGAAVTLTGPAPVALGTILAGESTTYVYSALATAAGNVFFTATAAGTDTGATIDAPQDQTSTVLIQTAAALSASLVVPSATVLCVGVPIIVTYTVSNSGQAGASAVVPVVTVRTANGAKAALAGPTPSAPAAVAGGAAVTFTFTATGSVVGYVFFTATAAGTDANKGNVVATGPQQSSTVLMTGLRASAAATPLVSVGQYFTVTLTVTNTSGAAVTSVVPKIRVGPGGASVVLVAGPSPATVDMLDPGASQTFSYTYSPTAAGVVTFSVTGSGATTCGTSPALGCAVASATIQTVAALAASIKAFTATATGMKFLVTLTVTNNGGATATNVKPATPVVIGTGSTSTTFTGPTLSTGQTVNGGAAVTFTWTYTAATLGTLGFTSTVSGTDKNSGAALSVIASAPPSGLKLALLPLKTDLLYGQSFMVTLTVTNSGAGAATVTNLAAVLWSSSLVAVSAPTPSAVAALAVGAGVTFTWTVTPQVAMSASLLAATVSLTATAAGTVTDSSGVGVLLVSAQAKATVTVRKAQTLSVRLSYARPDFGRAVQFILSVTNTGGTTVTNVTAGLWTNGVAVVDAASIPASVAALMPGQATAFTWNATPGSAGTITFTASAAGTTVTSAGAVAVASALTTAIVTGVPTPDQGASYVFPSPARDVARIAYTMAETGSVTIRVYNEIGDRVATLDDTAKAVGLQFSELATSGLAPGVYFYFLDITYDSGTSEKQKKRKFVVLH